MSAIPRKARGRRNQLFEADGVDEIISMVLELTAEVSAMRERQYLLERVLEANNIPAAAAIENYRQSASDQEHLAADRERLIATVLRNFQAPSGAEPPRAEDSEVEETSGAAA
ncbi:MAG: hypothetical protein ACI87W_001558 [Halieaceae bacterium]|jgi:hypothetical protein